MSTHKHVIFAILAFLGILLLGGAALVWPALNSRQRVLDDIAEIERKVKGLSGQATEVEALATEVHALRRRVQGELKQIPHKANLADLMRSLSLPVDGRAVADQTFTAGTPSEALAGEPSALRIMPLTIDMEATFESVFAVLQATESMPQLIRVASLHMNFQRDEKTENVRVPLIEASLGLEAVYESASAEPEL